MPPSRGKASSSKTADGVQEEGTHSKLKHRNTAMKQQKDSLEIPGVQKLKSALRQTRRLLAKDGLDADVRVKTERRLKSLEDDLRIAETRRKERTMATKYHKVKFFERKKVLRKIVQVKKELGSPSTPKAAKELEKKLFDLRVDLNYATNYPKLEKYIALFPTDGSEADASANEETTNKRKEIHDEIRGQMERGELPSEPELQKGKERSTQSNAHQPQKSNMSTNKGPGEESEGGSVEGDDFFEMASDGSD